MRPVSGSAHILTISERQDDTLRTLPSVEIESLVGGLSTSLEAQWSQ